VGKRLPSDSEGLWTFIHGLSDAERLDLLAHCVSLTVNAIRAPRQCADESEAHAAILAREVGLDMTAYWQPTAASYFGRVSKERIVQAVRDGASDQAAQNIASMKKQAMAEAAEAALAGKGWLPAVLYTGTTQWKGDLSLSWRDWPGAQPRFRPTSFLGSCHIIACKTQFAAATPFYGARPDAFFFV
jgi:ParB family chromosome partitioning protein